MGILSVFEAMNGTEIRPEVAVRVPQLASLRLFAGLNASTLEVLARELPTRRAQPGERLLAEGTLESDMYVLLEGAAEVRQAPEARPPVLLERLESGDWFGDMALLEPQPQPATVTAIAPCWLLQVSASQLDRLVYRRDPRGYAILMMNMAREMSRRLRRAQHRWVESRDGRSDET